MSMTRAQVDQILSEARARIADWKARLLPVAGAGVQVQGREVSLEPQEVPVRPEREPDTDTLVLWCRLTVTDSEVNGGTPFEVPLEAATLLAAGAVVPSNNTLFWEQAELVNFVPESDPPQSRSVVLEVIPRWHAAGTIAPGDTAGFADGRYKGRVQLTLNENNLNAPFEVAETHVLRMSRAGTTQDFDAPEAGYSFTQLLPSAVTRF